MNYKSHIPNTITILNLLSGTVAIILLFRGSIIEAALLVGLAAIFDFFDGFLARVLNAKSMLGKELDSLADVVSFGLAPAFFLYYLMSKNPNLLQGEELITYAPYLALAIVAFSALRLAKFNLDTRQSVYFLGLPTPANAIFIIPLTVVALSDSNSYPFAISIAGSLWFQIAIIPISCFLLISEVPMFAMKFSKGFGYKENKLRYTFLLISFISVALLGWTGISLSIVLYILLSLVFERHSLGA